MPTLALDTSARDAVVALDVAGQTHRRDVPRQSGRHAKMLIPTLRDLLAEHTLRPRDLDGIAVCLGPGSFTGLRVGVAAAQTLAWANGTRCVGVSLFEALAFASDHNTVRIAVANAEREQCFACRIFEQERTAGAFDIVDDDRLVELIEGSKDLSVIGSIPKRLEERIGDRIGIQAMPLVDAVLSIGRRRIEAGEAVPPHTLLPIYGRRSAAEELRDQGRRPKIEQR